MHMPRSPELMSADDTALLVVDMQERLLPSIRDAARVAWNVSRLVDGARVLGVPVLATEQYPRGLGPTVEPLASQVGPASEKLTFSCAGCGELFEPLAERGIGKILVVGVEIHVCVAQTVCDLLHNGFRVYVAADAVGSRFELDYQIALRRLETAGAVVTTTEAALFEWTQAAGTPEFKQISAIVKRAAPSA